MPNAWAADRDQPVRCASFGAYTTEFSARYPIDPPEVSLRSDFRRDIAHIQPWLTSDGRPVPCIQDGKMSEFMQHEGIAGILNQTVEWLDNAAEGRLIDPHKAGSRPGETMSLTRLSPTRRLYAAR